MKDYKFTRTRLTRKVILSEPDPPEKYFPFTRPTRPMQDYDFKPGLGKNPGNFKKPMGMGMGKTGFYREKWENGKNCLFLK
jgi:hypothetical protein